MTKWNIPDTEPKEDKGPLHPEGDWNAVVISSSVDKTKNGKDMIRLQFKTSKGKVDGRLVHSPESKGACYFFFRHLEAMGIEREWLEKEEPEIDDIASECVKSRVMITVSHREYLGETFSDVVEINPLPEAFPTKPPEEDNPPF